MPQPPSSRVRAAVFIIGLSLAAPTLFASSRVQAQTVHIASDSAPTTFIEIAKQTISAAADAVTSENALALQIKEYVLDPLAYAVVQQVKAAMVQSIVSWASNGFNGSPSFVVNLNVHLGNIVDQVASKFFSQIGNFSLDLPFKVNTAALLQADYYKSTSSNSFFLLNQCTLGSATVAVSSSGFDFNKGGLSGWFRFTMDSQNNPVGFAMRARDELIARATAAVTQSKDEITQNKGFLSWRGDCKLQGQAPQTVEVADPVVTTNPDGTMDFQFSDPVVKDNGANCLEYDIETPGSVIADAASKAIGTPIDSVISADEIDEIIGAVLQGLIKNVLGGSGFLGLSKPQGGGSDYFSRPDLAAADAGNVSNVVSNLSEALQQGKTQITKYQNDWKKIGAAADAAKTAATEAANSHTVFGACTFEEGANAGAVIETVVNPVIDQASAADAKAVASLQTLGILSEQVTPADGSVPAAGALARAGLNYQQFLSASTTPSASEIADAETQSTDSGGEGGTLITTMNNIVKEANACLSPVIH
ncbi:MAG: hypothetical protein WDN10_03345 [bacterium]